MEKLQQDHDALIAEKSRIDSVLENCQQQLQGTCTVFNPDVCYLKNSCGSIGSMFVKFFGYTLPQIYVLLNLLQSNVLSNIDNETNKLPTTFVPIS